MDKAVKRFTQTGEDMEVVFKPQCLKCTLNIDRRSCKAFKVKPIAYAKNAEECPKLLEK